MSRITRKKIKDTKGSSNTLLQLDLTDMYRTPLITAEYTLFLRTHEIFPKIYHMQSHKTSFGRFKGLNHAKYVLPLMTLKANNKRELENLCISKTTLSNNQYTKGNYKGN